MKINLGIPIASPEMSRIKLEQEVRTPRCQSFQKKFKTYGMIMKLKLSTDMI